MIVVDTSAIMAIILNEREADACIDALEAEDTVLISAGTMAEALIVSGRRNVGEESRSRADRPRGCDPSPLDSDGPRSRGPISSLERFPIWQNRFGIHNCRLL
jgi:hypothetical protein